MQGSPEEMEAARQGAGGDNAAGDDDAEASGDNEADTAPDAAAETKAADKVAAEQQPEPAPAAQQDEEQAMEVDATASPAVDSAAADEQQAEEASAAAEVAAGDEAAPAAAEDAAADAPAPAPAGKKQKRGGKKQQQQQGKSTPGKPAGVVKQQGGGRGRGPPGGRGFGALTMADISADKLTKLAAANWTGRGAATSASDRPPYNADLVATVYKEELGGGGDKPPAMRRVQVLEISQYLENYLWPHFEAGVEGAAAYEHLMSMVAMVNQKFREQVPGWACFNQHNKVGAWLGGRGRKGRCQCRRAAGWTSCLLALLGVCAKRPLRSLCQAGCMKQRVRIHRQAPQPVLLLASALCLYLCAAGGLPHLLPACAGAPG
jgi:hypothetical protein